MFRVALEREADVELLALAYELRCEGCCWKRIALGLGVDWMWLHHAVNAAVRYGIHDRRVVLTDAEFVAVHAMRSHSRLSWCAIAQYLDGSRDSHALQTEYYRRCNRFGLKYGRYRK